MRKVKIIATYGPAIANKESIAAMISTGVDVFRLNFSHGSADEKISAAKEIRSVAESMGAMVGILADLQGPKIRIGKFENKGADLQKGRAFSLYDSPALGNGDGVSLEWPAIISDTNVGDVLILDDGKMRLAVREKHRGLLVTEVLNDGRLSDNKGINRLGGGLSAGALTEKDMEDIKTAAALDADFLAVSFVSSAEEMNIARKAMADAGGDAWLIAKIERAESISNLDAIIDASDGVMVARGDLALEVGDASVPLLQKTIIKKARAAGRFAITATQMLESMIENPSPTRAEVSDIANAVLDGTDAIMLSAESATGRHPTQAVAVMVDVASKSEAMETCSSTLFMPSSSDGDDLIISAAAYYASEMLNPRAVLAVTSTGSTAVWLSRRIPKTSVIAVSNDAKAAHKTTILRGVVPRIIQTPPNQGFEPIWDRISDSLVREGMLSSGDAVLITFGTLSGIPGGTNSLRIMRVP